MQRGSPSQIFHLAAEPQTRLEDLLSEWPHWTRCGLSDHQDPQNLRLKTQLNREKRHHRNSVNVQLAFIHSGAVHSQCGFMFKNVRRRPMEWETWCVFLEHTSCEMLQKTADVRATVRYILCERPIKVKLHSKTYKPFKNSSQISHLWDIMKCIKTVF